MSRSVCLVAMIVAFILASSKESSAQFIAAWPFTPPVNTEILVLPGAAFTPIKVGRVAAGVGFHAGGLWDSADRHRIGRHVHLVWMPTIPVTYRIGKSWGVAGGFGRIFVRKSAQPHLQNRNTFFAGLALGLKP